MCGNVGTGHLGPGFCDQPQLWGQRREERGRLPSDLPSLFLVPVTSSSPQQTDTEQGTQVLLCQCLLLLLKAGDAGGSSDQSSVDTSLDVGLPDDPDGADDDDAAPPDAGVRRQQAEAGHQLHDEPRQHGELPGQGQEAAGGSGECTARGSQVGGAQELRSTI